MEGWGCFGIKKDSQKQMPEIDFSKKGENDYSVVARVSFQIFSNNLPKRDLLFPQKPTLNLPMIRPKPTFKSGKSKQC